MPEKEKMINVKVFRFDPTQEKEPHYKNYTLPVERGTSAFNLLEDIYHEHDGSLSFYSHAGCGLGICGKCQGRVNGKPGLLCQTLVEEDVTIEPIFKNRVAKDMVINKSKKEEKNEQLEIH